MRSWILLSSVRHATLLDTREKITRGKNSVKSTAHFQLSRVKFARLIALVGGIPKVFMKRKRLFHYVKERWKLYCKSFYAFLLQCFDVEIFQFEFFVLPTNDVLLCI